MIHPCGTGTAGLPLGVIAPVQDAQSALRDRLIIDANTPSAAPRTLIARPVPGVGASEGIRTEWRGLRDPTLTGPRPTFTTTPLEKMQSDRRETMTRELNTKSLPDAIDKAQPPDEAPSEKRAQSAYDGLRAIDRPEESEVALDRVT